MKPTKKKIKPPCKHNFIRQEELKPGIQWWHFKCSKCAMTISKLQKCTQTAAGFVCEDLG